LTFLGEVTPQKMDHRG